MAMQITLSGSTSSGTANVLFVGPQLKYIYDRATNYLPDDFSLATPAYVFAMPLPDPVIPPVVTQPAGAEGVT
eukprot:4001278-Prymnesium_polylepis.2